VGVGVGLGSAVGVRLGVGVSGLGVIVTVLVRVTYSKVTVITSVTPEDPVAWQAFPARIINRQTISNIDPLPLFTSFTPKNFKL